MKAADRVTASLGDHWTAEYANIVEFYFWEPRHLNRVSPPPEKRRPADQVLGDLMRREVPLNHQLSLFFRLAPTGLIRRWLGGIVEIDLAAPRLTDPLAYRRSKVFGACQADLWFEANVARCFAELKVDARSSLQQLCKYGLLQAALNDSHGVKPAALVFMGPSAGRFANIADHIAGRHSPEFVLPDSVTKHATRLAVTPESVLESVRAIEIGHTDYSAFDSFLADEEARVPVGEGGETMARLLGGMRAFLAATVL